MQEIRIFRPIQVGDEGWVFSESGLFLEFWDGINVDSRVVTAYSKILIIWGEFQVGDPFFGAFEVRNLIQGFAFINLLI